MTKHVLVSDDIHKVVRMISAREGMTIGSVVEAAIMVYNKKFDDAGIINIELKEKKPGRPKEEHISPIEIRALDHANLIPDYVPPKHEVDIISIAFERREKWLEPKNKHTLILTELAGHEQFLPVKSFEDIHCFNGKPALIEVLHADYSPVNEVAHMVLSLMQRGKFSSVSLALLDEFGFSIVYS